LLLVDIDAEPLEDLAHELVARGVRAKSLVLDLARPDAGERVAAATREHLGGIDVLISNAGVVSRGPLVDLGVEEYENVFALNVRATWVLAQALYPLLTESRGCLIATGALAVEQPTALLGAYSASKAALGMLVRQLSHEWGPAGIRCNCVSPGMTWTASSEYARKDAALAKRRASAVPLGRVADPEDIASVIAFLASPDAGYVTGINLIVDGGATTSLMPLLTGQRGDQEASR
jgi:NAD(P)-dependent dehydrogenase (short-subunit alcohol dehydrogenase family)